MCNKYIYNITIWMSQVEIANRDSVDITVKHKSCSRYAQGSYFELLFIDLFNFAVPPENYHIDCTSCLAHFCAEEVFAFCVCV